MANDFSWKRDFKSVDWQSTLKYNLIRSAAAGIVWGAVMFAMAIAGNAPLSVGLLALVLYPVAFPICYLTFYLPGGLLAAFVGQLPIPFVGLIAGCITTLFALTIAVGDPLVYLLFKRKPEWIPVDHPGIFNLRLIIYIIGDPSRPRVPRAASPMAPPQPTAPNLAIAAPSSQTMAASSQGSPVGTTQPSFAPQSATSFFGSKPFIVLVITAVVLCGGIVLLKSVAEKTALSFDFLLDGKALSAGRVPDVKVDGQPFRSGSKIGMGRHEITVQLQDVEPLHRRFWVVSGAKNLGTLPLEASKGSLTVTVYPSPASVAVRRAGESVRQGEAPLNVEVLPTGDYVLVIRRGEYEETQSVNVRRQQRTEAKIDLKLGSADISAEPADAEFDLSGGGRHWQGKLPIRVNDVPVGNYLLVARRKGWELTETVSVSRGNATTNRIEFPYGSIDVSSEPSSLVVSTNGVEVGKTPITLRELRPGAYQVAATDGENDLVAIINVDPKEKVKKSFVFRYGSVELASTPAAATVVRKGKQVGKTPLMLDHVPAGETLVELRLDGYMPTNLQVRAVESEVAKYEVRLINEKFLASLKAAHAAAAAIPPDFPGAIENLNQALQISPDDVEGLQLRKECEFGQNLSDASLLLKKDDLEGALERIDSALLLKPSDTTAIRIKENIATAKTRKGEQAASEAERRSAERARMAALDFDQMIQSVSQKQLGRSGVTRLFASRTTALNVATDVTQAKQALLRSIKWHLDFEETPKPDVTVTYLSPKGSLTGLINRSQQLIVQFCQLSNTNLDVRVKMVAGLYGDDTDILENRARGYQIDFLRSTAAFRKELSSISPAMVQASSSLDKSETVAPKGPTQATQIDTEPNSPIGIIQKAIAAHGGREVLEKYKAYKKTRASVENQNDAPIDRSVVYFEYPDKRRTDFGVPTTHTICVAGKSAWRHVYAVNRKPQVQNLETGTADDVRAWIRTDNLCRLVPLLDGTYEIKPAADPSETPPNTIAVDVQIPTGPVTMLFDRDTRLLVGLLSIFLESNGHRRIQVQRFSEFRNFSGLIAPTVTKSFRNGILVVTWNTESFTPSESLPPEIFQRPAKER